MLLRDCTGAGSTSGCSPVHTLPATAAGSYALRQRSARTRSRGSTNLQGVAAAAAPLEEQQHSALKHLQQRGSSLVPDPLLPAGVLQQQLPKHVAIIMDGNSRWAEARGLPAWVGHERGVAALKAAVKAARQWGIPALTVYAFSLENWQRDASEVAFLMNLFQSALEQQLPELQENGVRLNFMGQLHRLPAPLQQQIAACQAGTANNDELLLTVAVSYSAQQDVVAAVQQLAQQVQAGTLVPEQITPAMLARSLASYGVTAAVGPPDLLIRTSGEQRLSNFMLWEVAYTELCFLDVMWPDFDKQQFEAALQQYAARQRRYGRRHKQGRQQR